MPTSPDGSRAERPYGWRARLGLIVPPTNTVNEAEWAFACPSGVTVHTARMPLHLDSATPEGRRRLEDDLRRAALDLAAAEVDVIAYGCTAGSLVLPLDTITSFVSRETGIPAVATAPAIVEALRDLGARRLVVATPYHDALNEHEARFLEACGFEVVRLRGLGLGAGGLHEFRLISRVTPTDLLAFVMEVDHPEADAVVVSCTDLPTMAIHQALAARLGKPVVTSNQATFQAALRRAGVAKDPAWGVDPGVKAEPAAGRGVTEQETELD
ncbi:MAG: aspartate/glutamate racemase family protein [Methylobacteriaceae bacterium]|nr:aspartate/glutamate racemase family protein [Methylobacteriaceae bacterium]